jgi:hypothetical protein
MYAVNRGLPEAVEWGNHCQPGKAQNVLAQPKTFLERCAVAETAAALVWMAMTWL